MRITKFLLSVSVFLALPIFENKSFAGEFIVNGFYSVYARKPLGRNSLETERDFTSRDVDYSEYTKAGLNIRNDFYKNWSFVAQMVASGRHKGISPGYRWSDMMDWMYLSYQNKYLETKLGRQLFPSWLVSEYSDVGYTYPWYRPPLQVYSILPFKSFEGLSINYQKPVGRNNFAFRLFAGGGRPVHDDLDEFFVTRIDNLYGGMLSYGGVGWQFQATMFQYTHEVGLKFTVVPTGGAGGLPPFIYVPSENTYRIQRVDATSVGFRYDRKFVFYTEWGKTCCSDEQDPYYDEDSSQLVNYFRGQYGYYATIGYHFGKFLPHFTHSYGDWDKEGQAGRMRTDSYGLNYQINPTMIFKIDYSFWEVRGSEESLLSGSGKAETFTAGVDAIF